MKRLSVLFVLLISGVMAVVGGYSCSGQSDEQSFSVAIDTTFDFAPSELPRIELENRIAEVQAFWDMVNSDTARYLPLLRSELQDLTRDGLFLFECSKLLFVNSKSSADLEICVNAMAKVPLGEVPHHDYLQFVVTLGAEGVNTFPAILNILYTTDFNALIPSDTVALDHKVSVVQSCIQLPDEWYVDSLIARLDEEWDAFAVEAILLTLSYTVTEKGFEAVAEYIRNARSERTRSFRAPMADRKQLPARQVTSRYEDIDRYLEVFESGDYEAADINFSAFTLDLPYMVKKSDYDRIKEARRRAARRVSNQAGYEISYLTKILQLAYSSDE